MCEKNIWVYFWNIYVSVSKLTGKNLINKTCNANNSSIDFTLFECTPFLLL